MEMTPVDSTNLAAVGYDLNTATMRISFLKGGTYDYYSVPIEVYEGLMSAGSKGEYHNLYIKKGGYSYSRV